MTIRMTTTRMATDVLLLSFMADGGGVPCVCPTCPPPHHDEQRGSNRSCRLQALQLQLVAATTYIFATLAKCLLAVELRRRTAAADNLFFWFVFVFVFFFDLSFFWLRWRSVGLNCSISAARWGSWSQQGLSFDLILSKMRLTRCLRTSSAWSLFKASARIGTL